MHRRAATVAAGLLALAAAAAASAGTRQEAEHRLHAARHAEAAHKAEAAKAAQAAGAAKARHQALVQQEIAATAALRQTEQKTAAITAKLRALDAERQAAQTELDADSRAVGPLVPLMLRLALHPAAMLLAADAAPGQAAEGALVMRGLTRLIGDRARSLHEARSRLASAETAARAEQARLTEAVAAQQSQAALLQQKIDAVDRLEATAESRESAERRAAHDAAARAHSLAGVIARIGAAERRAARRKSGQNTQQAAARIAPPSGPKGAPVAGQLVRAFGQSTIAGAATGDTFATAPGAVVSATCTGTVIFARPFQNYGKLLIIDCGHADDFVIAGMDRFDVRTGQHVEAGQPVGRMAGYDPHDPGHQPKLYLELRHGGTPVDPAPALAHGLG